HGSVPTRGVADADGRGYRIRLFNRMPINDWRGAGRLPAEHSRQTFGLSDRKIFLKPFPVSGDIAGVAHWKKMKVRRAAQLVADFKRGGFLSVDPIRVDAVDHFHFSGLTQFADDAQGVVEVALHRDGRRAI